MMDEPVHIPSCFSTFEDLWEPLTVATMNDYDVRVVKVRGEFVWHSHAETDELFFVLDGKLTIDMEDRDGVDLSPGDLFVVAAGLRHRPRAEKETKLMLVEPSSVVNTGDG